MKSSIRVGLQMSASVPVEIFLKRNNNNKTPLFFGGTFSAGVDLSVKLVKGKTWLSQSEL